MALHLYTARIGSYKGQDVLDITAKSGEPAFAPTWELVMDWKEGRITWQQYTDRYRTLMLDSYGRDPQRWLDLLRRDTLTLMCYCRADEEHHCHRYLLAEFLARLGKRTGTTVVNEGERQKEPDPQQSLFAGPDKEGSAEKETP
jgi:uncharacterized protein YeaO (DUF488 family)